MSITCVNLFFLLPYMYTNHIYGKSWLSIQHIVLLHQTYSSHGWIINSRTVDESNLHFQSSMPYRLQLKYKVYPRMWHIYEHIWSDVVHLHAVIGKSVKCDCNQRLIAFYNNSPLQDHVYDWVFWLNPFGNYYYL